MAPILLGSGVNFKPDQTAFYFCEAPPLEGVRIEGPFATCKKGAAKSLSPDADRHR
jgi:hypothetical protein